MDWMLLIYPLNWLFSHNILIVFLFLVGFLLSNTENKCFSDIFKILTKLFYILFSVSLLYYCLFYVSRWILMLWIIFFRILSAFFFQAMRTHHFFCFSIFWFTALCYLYWFLFCFFFFNFPSLIFVFN